MKLNCHSSACTPSTNLDLQQVVYPYRTEIPLATELTHPIERIRATELVLLDFYLAGSLRKQEPISVKHSKTQLQHIPNLGIPADTKLSFQREK